MEASMTTLDDGGFGAAAAAAALHHTPVKSRDLGIDMEAIRLSRQDNPYLKVGGEGVQWGMMVMAGSDESGSGGDNQVFLVKWLTFSGVNECIDCSFNWWLWWWKW